RLLRLTNRARGPLSNLLNRQGQGLLAVEVQPFALVKLPESVVRQLPEQVQLLRISLRLNLKQAQPGAHHLTGVLVLSTFNERGDEFIVMVGEINVPGGHFRPQLQSILDSDERSGATNFWKRY